MNKFQAAIIAMAVELRDEPGWLPFARYLEHRAQGAQSPALRVVEQFVEDARHWPYEERKRFSLWLMNRSGHVLEQIGSARNSERGRSFVAPDIITEKLLIPMLTEWIERDPQDPEPHFWSGLYSYTLASSRNPVQFLRKAIWLDACYAPALEALARDLLAAVEYNQHELPSGYLGEGPETDLTKLHEAEELIAGLDVGTDLTGRISEMRVKAENAIRGNTPRASNIQGS